MGSFDGIYMQSILAKITSKNNMGLYRDDDLIDLKNNNGQQTDKIKKKIAQIFKDTNFRINIITNLVEINFLDVTFYLANKTYRPYKKPKR